ncbi:MAG TPA: carboxypeptidase M32 [Planctomycetota bacterium]
MDVAKAESRVFALWGELRDLDAATEALGWDQETCMPAKGQAARGKVLATLAGLAHAKATEPALADAVAALEQCAEPGSVAAAQARLARRRIDRAAKVPAALAKAMAEHTSKSLASWQAARKQKDFGLFRADLAEMLRLKREEARALAGSGNLYDAMLDDYEPGSTEAALVPLFAQLRERLSPLVKAVAGADLVVDESPVRGRFPAAAQEAFGREIAAQMGFDFQAGRLDLAAHPFCSGFAPSDVRITWRHQEDDIRPALFGIMHEAGHGLYEQGLAPEWERTPAGPAVSLGVHESQSRLWENLVGRSRAFWEWALPIYQRHFPDKRGVTVDAIWPALHTCKPSYIRVEADEATYNLHVAARFELERRLFAGDLEAADLPQAWDDTYEELLGIRPRDVAEGVLQDIHWSMGLYGYFPTYTLGNLINSQLFERMGSDLGDLDARMARGELGPLREWLRENVHRHGSRYPAPELVERASGKPLGTEAFLGYITRTTEAVYGVTV